MQIQLLTECFNDQFDFIRNTIKINFLNTYRKVIKMNDFTKDILLGLIFTAGIYGFISGEFILSSILFASAATYTNILLTLRLK